MTQVEAQQHNEIHCHDMMQSAAQPIQNIEERDGEAARSQSMAAWGWESGLVPRGWARRRHIVITATHEVVVGSREICMENAVCEKVGDASLQDMRIRDASMS